MQEGPVRENPHITSIGRSKVPRLPTTVRGKQGYLRSHPVREYVEYLIRGWWEGFRISVDYQRHQYKSNGENMRLDLPKGVLYMHSFNTHF